MKTKYPNRLIFIAALFGAVTLASTAFADTVHVRVTQTAEPVIPQIAPGSPNATHVQNGVNTLINGGPPPVDFSHVEKTSKANARIAAHNKRATREHERASRIYAKQAKRLDEEARAARAAIDRELSGGPREVKPLLVNVASTPSRADLIDLGQIPDPLERDLPHEFMLRPGQEREELVSLYQNLYKIQPAQGKQRKSREFGLASVESADLAYSQGMTYDGDVYRELAEGFLDLAVGLDPVTGTARSAYELFVGRNFVTGAKLSDGDRAFAAIGVLSLGTTNTIRASFRAVRVISQKAPSIIRQVGAIETAVVSAEKLVHHAVDDPKSRATFERLLTDYRQQMEKPLVKNEDLQRIMGRLFRPDAVVGNKSTGAAIRRELKEGEPTFDRFHSVKGLQMISALKSWISGHPHAHPSDIRDAENALKDLLDALEGQ